VIGSILLVMLVIVIAVIVYGFSVGFVSDRAEKAELDAVKKELCDEAGFSVDNVCYEDVGVENLGSGTIEAKQSIKFIVGNDDLNVELYGFLVYLDSASGSSNYPSLDKSEVQTFGSKDISTPPVDISGDISQLRIVPRLKEGGEVFDCEDKEIVIPWSEVSVGC